MQDNFTFQYYSGTNKLSRVSGNVDQFRYDLNGNVITDSVYNNFSISYDHRNLITELYHIDTLTSTRQYSYATRYWYDEAGNRVRKLTYRNAQIPPPQINDWAIPGNGWTLLNNEHYVRGVDGKELATYSGNTLTEWYIWGNDMVGIVSLVVLVAAESLKSTGDSAAGLNSYFYQEAQCKLLELLNN